MKQAGRLWSKLLHGKLEEAKFTRCVTDMCLYYKRDDNDTTLVGVYVDDLLVIASIPRVVKDFFDTMSTLSIKDLGEVKEVLGMHGNSTISMAICWISRPPSRSFSTIMAMRYEWCAGAHRRGGKQGGG